ncbi:hypothetical protein VNI00_001989 [Paramarasmius palmivorus]|uniref:F-box domain-containing protein n=1 Tax=Paramarasmius palmivorus TaxID=297713 RepID=A0AAW0E3T2_9AGAR
MSFARLPNEIIEGIAHELDSGRDIKNLRLVNKQLDHAASLVLWTTKPVVVSIDKNSFKDAIAMLQELPNTPRVTKSVRALIFKSISPSFNPEGHREFANSVDSARNALRVSREWIRQTKEDTIASERVKDLLPGFVSALVGLRSVRWNMTLDDPEWAWQVVMECSSSLPALETLSVTCPVLHRGLDTFNNPLHLFPHGTLKEITLNVTATFSAVPSSFHTFLSEIIHNNRKLEVISIRTYYIASSASSEPFAFHTIFDKLPSSYPLPLRKLVINLPKVQLSAKVLEQMKSIRHLELTETLRGHNIALGADTLWPALQEERIHLRTLVMKSRVNEALIDYLESFSSLEAIDINIGSSGNNNDLARRFFENVIPLHKDTLKHVFIKPITMSFWAINFERLRGFYSCKNLVSLSVCVDFDADENEDSVATLIHLSVSLESLRSLELDCTRKGLDAFFRMSRVLEALQKQRDARKRLYKLMQNLRLEKLIREPHPKLLVNVFQAGPPMLANLPQNVSVAIPNECHSFGVQRHEVDGTVYYTFRQLNDSDADTTGDAAPNDQDDSR